jgi:mannose-6-phosphate isomerase-like protein (cupin superfamily)
MPTLIDAPNRIAAAGHPPKRIDEFVGRVRTKTEDVSVAHMRSPSGWTEPGQRPDFDEHTVVLAGALHVEFEGGSFEVRPGQAVTASRGEWVRYSTPGPEGAEYIAVCVPAFTLEAAHRDE